MSEVDCILCVGPIDFFGVGQCDHTYICHICIYKLRVLQRSKLCPVCKCEQDLIVITDDLSAQFATEIMNQRKPSAPGQFLYANRQAEEAMYELFSIKCPIQTCSQNERFPNVNVLKKHLCQEHHLYLCDLCVAHKTCAVSEQVIYTKDELQAHLRNGDINEDEVVFFHPFCKFCTQHFFDDDHMLEHLRNKHEKCPLCKENPYTFYQSYTNLNRHFAKTHYPCQDQNCVDKKYIAFNLQQELDVHHTTVHQKSTKISPLLLQQITGFYNNTTETKSLQLKDKEGFDFSTSLLTVSKNRNKGFKTSKEGPTDLINLLEHYGVPYNEQESLQRPFIQVVHIEDLTLYKQIQLQNWDLTLYRVQFVMPPPAFEQLFMAYMDNRITASEFTDSIFRQTKESIALYFFQFLCRCSPNVYAMNPLRDIYLDKLRELPSLHNSLLSKCNTNKEAIQMLNQYVEDTLITCLSQLGKVHLIEKPRLKQLQQISRSCSNRDKLVLKFSSNFAIDFSTKEHISHMIKLSKENILSTLSRIELKQLMLVYLYYNIALNYQFEDDIGINHTKAFLDNCSFNILEPLLKKFEPQIQQQTIKQQAKPAKPQLSQQVQPQPQIQQQVVKQQAKKQLQNPPSNQPPNPLTQENQKETVSIQSKKPFSSQVGPILMSPPSDDEDALKDHGFWEQDQQKKEKILEKKQEIGRIKKKGKTKVLLAGGFK